MGPQTIRFLIQIVFAFCGMLAVFYVPEPYGQTLGLFLVVIGLWLGRRIYKRLTIKDVEARKNWQKPE